MSAMLASAIVVSLWVRHKASLAFLRPPSGPSKVKARRPRRVTRSKTGMRARTWFSLLKHLSGYLRTSDLHCRPLSCRPLLHSLSSESGVHTRDHVSGPYRGSPRPRVSHGLRYFATIYSGWITLDMSWSGIGASVGPIVHDPVI